MPYCSIEQLYSFFQKYPVVCTDTRTIKKDSLFFALKGDNFNGNEFADKALENGSAYVIIDEEKYMRGEKYLLVKDVLTSLQDLAKYHRSKLKIPFIGITGSNGKTTSKELVHAVLSKKFKTLATLGNLNNHIGVPLTLLSITAEHELAIIEMGANHLKEIAFLSSIASPDYGLITNFGKAHLEGFGSAENIVIAKSELYDHVRSKKGVLFVNGDNELMLKQAGSATKITYGTTSECDFKASFLKADPFVELSIQSFENNQTIKTQLIGKYNFDNCVAAACIGNYFGVSESAIKAALENYVPSNNRSQVVKKNTHTILLDAYNANPSSMEVAIVNFAEMNAQNKVVLLGDMLELGKDTRMEHLKILNLLTQKGFTEVYLVGPNFKACEEHNKFTFFENTSAAFDFLSSKKFTEKTFLIKGSRGIKLETLVDAIG